MDEQLHVIQSKLLNIFSQMTLLIHALDEGEGSGAHLKHTQTKYFKKKAFEVFTKQTFARHKSDMTGC